MSAVIPSARLIDAIILLLVLEMAALTAYRVVRGTGMPVSELIAFLGAGFAMLVALRVVVADGPVAAFAAAMLLSLVLHVWHVRQRWFQ